MAMIRKRLHAILLAVIFSINGNAQETSSEQKIIQRYFLKDKKVDDGSSIRISLRIKGASLYVLYDSLRVKTKSIVINHAYLLRSSKKVDVDFNNATIQQCVAFLEKEFYLQSYIGDGVINLIPRKFSGIVKNRFNQPIEGALVEVKHNNKILFIHTDADGKFIINYITGSEELDISSEGKESIQWVIDAGERLFVMKDKIELLPEVEVAVELNDGFRKLNGKRATGSYGKWIPDKGYKPNVNAINGIELSNGLTNQPHQSFFGVKNFKLRPFRGPATLSGNTEPLQVLDMFPYPDNPNYINAGDIHDFTSLKDASSGVLYGSFSANGVAITNLKKGMAKEFTIQLLNNVTVAKKVDVNFIGKLDAITLLGLDSVAAYTDNTGITSQTWGQQLYTTLRNRPMSRDSVELILARLRSNNLYKEMQEQFFQNKVHHQHLLSIQGGYPYANMYASIGYDYIKQAEKGNDWQRLTALINSSIKVKKLVIELLVSTAYIKEHLNHFKLTSNVSYLSLRNPDGTPAEFAYQYPFGFPASVAGQGFLDWSNRPIDEAGYLNNLIQHRFILISNSIKYPILPNCTLTVAGRYSLSRYDFREKLAKESFSIRDQVNLFRQIDSAGKYNFPFPYNDLTNLYASNSDNNFLRAQFDYKLQKENVGINAMIAFDRMSFHTVSSLSRKYAADNIDLIKLFPLSIYPGREERIPNPKMDNDSSNRFLSGIASLDAIFFKKYVVSLNGRRDLSNRFSEDMNKWGIGLWSIGAAWNAGEEDFIRSLGNISDLKVKATYGVNGNINYGIAPYQTIEALSQNNAYRLIYPNPSGLRWEKQGMLNVGVDVTIKKKFTFGFERYYKDAKDLLRSEQWSPISGYSLVKSNSGKLKGKGTDIMVGVNELTITKSLKYTAQLLFSRATNEVTAGDAIIQKAQDIVHPLSYLPMELYPVNALFAFRSAGLNPTTGAPRGYLNGQISEDYTGIFNSTDRSVIRYIGSAVPTSFFNFRQSFVFDRLGISFLLTGRFGYFVWAPALNYYALYNDQNGGTDDFSNRWQKPGDEQFTTVPALIFPLNYNSDMFYAFSEDNVVKADNIKLQNFQVSWYLDKKTFGKVPIKKMEFIISVDNIGFVWKANGSVKDPDVYPGAYPNPASATFSMHVTF